jgi:hypothetical protein
MFKDDLLQEELETASTINLQSAVIAEWNMNIAENILQAGNYRYRPNDPEDSRYRNVSQSFEIDDKESRFYTDATDADITIDGGLKQDRILNTDGTFTIVDSPAVFKSQKEKEKILFSLEDCFGRFRPRSGINKLRYFENSYSHYSSPDMALRPRYYMADKNDKFKYWSSYRTEDGVERGIANQDVGGQFYIDDAAPYVVYKDVVPANRIVVKMQTNVGSIEGTNFFDISSSLSDPFFGEENKTTPVSWRIQYLQNNNWVDAVTFDATSARRDGSPIISPDGYVELVYGLIVPEQYAEKFNFVREFSSSTLLPPVATQETGDAFLVKTSENDAGVFWVVPEAGDYDSFDANYGWYLDDNQNKAIPQFVESLTAPPAFTNEEGSLSYREFANLQGLRVVAKTMNRFDSTFDLIELSPRLTVDLSGKTDSFSIKKSASDLGVTGMPVGQLLAAVGSVGLFDYDQAFLPENQISEENPDGSIIAKYLSQHIQIKFYEVILLPNNEYRMVPIKAMYSEGFPQINNRDRSVTITLRDLFFYFETTTAPQILIQNASLSYAVSLLLDSVGFSNYIFKRNLNEEETIIPFFFVSPDVSVAEVLEELAISTQSAMFFDEYNDFIIMSKGYMMPSVDERETDIVIRGSHDFEKSGVYLNRATGDISSNGKNNLSNIEDITFKQNEIYNDGIINYTSRYIQRSYNSVRNAFDLDRDKTWTYKASLLWEVSSTENTKSINEEVNDQSGYALTAIPLNSDLTDELPQVVDNALINNVIDLGDGVRWIARYNGYFYANGEIIRYDAVQFSIPGLSDEERELPNVEGDNVWISSIREYQRYFSKIPFNGKMYPTGLIRVYSEPNYEIFNEQTRLQNGAVAKHGRAQFGTKAVNHYAGINPEWLSDENLKGCLMESRYLFNKNKEILSTGAESVGSVISVKDVSGISVGFRVEIVEGIGALDPNTRVISVSNAANTVTVSPEPLLPIEETYIAIDTSLEKESILKFLEDPQVVRSTSSANKAAGIDNNRVLGTTRTDIISDIFAKQYVEEIPYKPRYSGSLQSSALIMSGNSFSSTESSLDFISYVYKPLDDSYKHFGTRMRVVGKVENNIERGQSPSGVDTYYTVQDALTNQSSAIGGASGGIGIMVNPTTNNGYFLEIAALTESNIGQYEDVDNIYFYKVSRRADITGQPLVQDADKAIPVKLWGGSANILVDDGQFTGQSRVAGESNPTVYDLAIEYEDLSDRGLRRFYLYVNNVLIGTVDDTDPLDDYNNTALFIRGASKVMFENIYALTNNYAKEKTFSLGTPVNSVFGTEEISANAAFQKYAISGLVQSTFLSGISPSEEPDHKIFFDEFGTIMREAAYFNIRYDKAYPALIAKIAPTYGSIKGFTVSGFLSDAYGAEFLVFNATDNIISLDSTTGNYLRILGVTFTQESEEQLTVDEYFSKVGDLSNPKFVGSNLVTSPLQIQQEYQDIKFSRITDGEKAFSINATYIQSKDEAENLMEWLVSKIMKPRKSVGVSLFGLPTLQLGDIVQIDYENKEGIQEVADVNDRFVVYHIEYDRDPNGPSSTVYLSEVL